MELKLLTVNLHAWLEENQEEKFKIISKFILEKDIDIVAFQEVNQNKEKRIIDANIREDNPSLIISNFLKEKGKNYNFVWDWSHYGYDMYEEGLSILTKYPISSTKSIYISDSKDFKFWKTRKTIKAELKIEDKIVNVYSCHMGWLNDNEEPFEKQIIKLNSFVRENNNLSLVMGDFNNSDDSEGYSIIKQLGYKDLYKKTKENQGFTIKEKIDGWEENDKFLRIDYIFSNIECEILESSVVFEENRVSDHFGVYSKIKY
ncbi:MAG: endonuclease/exonuclease/phosphatase family protein [Fusobacteriaceae bacterium]|nr:endonuclease/exonuclease/phosphatase family protein [Fusobacteriaceae bacterium]